MSQIKIIKQGRLGRLADTLMKPVMFVLQGNFTEVPQRTHRWNNQHLNNYNVSQLKASQIIIVPGDPEAKQRWFGFIPLFHMPLFGGWTKFVVIKPVDEVAEWYIGWVAYDALGLSKIPLQGAVRVCVGPSKVSSSDLMRKESRSHSGW